MYLLVGCIENENRADFLQLRTCFCEHTLHTMQCPPAHTVQATTTPCTHHHRRILLPHSQSVIEKQQQQPKRCTANEGVVGGTRPPTSSSSSLPSPACGTQSTVQCSQLCARPHIMTINKQKTGFIQKCVTLIFRPNCISGRHPVHHHH